MKTTGTFMKSNCFTDKNQHFLNISESVFYLRIEFGKSLFIYIRIEYRESLFI